MTTVIAQNLAGSRSRLALAALVGTATVGADLLSRTPHSTGGLLGFREVLAVVSVGLLLALVRGDRVSLGLVVTPRQGWIYWCRTTIVIAIVLGTILFSIVGLWYVMGGPVRIRTLPPKWLGRALMGMCIRAPLVEECIYRIALCVPAAILLRPMGCIVASGILFGLAHVAGGNAGPDNLLAGYLLGWAFLKSGTILVPIALHSLGNLWVAISQLAAWYWFASPTP